LLSLVGQLEQYTGGGFGVDECNSSTFGAYPRRFVNEAVACGPAGHKRGIQIGHAIADVMNAGTSLGKEFPNRTFGLERGQQLDLRIAERESQNPSPIYLFGWMRFQAEDIAVERQRGSEIGNGNSNMSNAGAVRHRSPPSLG
jgi:hypothetical protein